MRSTLQKLKSKTGLLYLRRDYFCPQLKSLNPAGILLISDLHLDASASPSDQAYLNLIHELAKQNSPAAIIFAGDTINSVATYQTPVSRNLLKNFFRNLTRLAPVFVAMGNHEYSDFSASGKHRFNTLVEILHPQPVKFHSLAQYKTFLQDIPVQKYPLRILDNSNFYSSKLGVNLIGLTLSPEYYGLNLSPRLRHEQPTILRQTLVNYKTLLRSPASAPDAPNILFVHSPIHLTPDILQTQLKDVSLIISGHMHNGVVPTRFTKLSNRGSRGLLAPDKTPLPARARNSEAWSNNKLITLNQVKLFTEEKRLLFPLSRHLFPPTVTFLHPE